MEKIRKAISYLFLIIAFAALLLCSGEVLDSAKRGLSLCAKIIVPSLLPFFILSSLIGDVGLPTYLGNICAPLMSRLFGVSGAGAAAFILGVTGGYPLGASVVSGLVARKEICREEGARLLAFCNNSGPAFIIGAAGIGVFQSSGAGLMLYAAHVLAAATVGVLLSGEGRARKDSRAAARLPVHIKTVSLAEALPNAVRTSVASVLSICGFVVTFTVCVGVLDAAGIFPQITGELARFSGLGLRVSRALLTGLLEIGSGIGSLEGLSPTPVNLAAAAFILGWGGLSVHFQTIAVTAEAKINIARHTAGRFLSGLISAIYVLGLCLVF
ncbi:MAG TPA: sporulation protein [Clostridiales bacterium]|nr:sporulation protein [Clostridiales bacterium]